MAEASELKFCIQLKFANAHHKIPPRGKRGCGLRPDRSVKFGVFYIFFSTMAEVVVVIRRKRY